LNRNRKKLKKLNLYKIQVFKNQLSWYKNQIFITNLYIQIQWN
jgi:hypothetical protein